MNILAAVGMLLIQTAIVAILALAAGITVYEVLAMLFPKKIKSRLQA